MIPTYIECKIQHKPTTEQKTPLTIHQNIHPRDIPPRRTAKQHHRARQLRRLPDPPERRARDIRLHAREHALVRGHRRLHEPRAHAVHADAVLRPLRGEVGREPEHGGLGDAVRGRVEREERLVPGDGGDEHDAAARVLLDHHPGRRDGREAGVSSTATFIFDECGL
jgi:hypothetical protein